jgi:hypothetical protein
MANKGANTLFTNFNVINLKSRKNNTCYNSIQE